MATQPTCISVHSTCAWWLRGQKTRASALLELELDSWELPCEFWELSLILLEVQPVLLTIELPLIVICVFIYLCETVFHWA